MLQFLFIFELNILFGNMKKMSWGGGGVQLYGFNTKLFKQLHYLKSLS